MEVSGQLCSENRTPSTHWMDRSLGWAQSPSGLCEEKDLLLLPGLNLGCPACSLVTIPTELYLQHFSTLQLAVLLSRVTKIINKLDCWQQDASTKIIITFVLYHLQQWPIFNPRSGYVGSVVDKVALGQVFSKCFGFPCQFSFHQLLHNH
jgi:hypothetical protein